MDDATVRDRLLDERARLSSTAGHVADEIDLDETERSSVAELSSFDQHQADLASETFEREKEITIIASLEEQVAQIDAALARLEQGTFGKCETCGKPIGEDRLEALPTARLCIEDAKEAGGDR